MTITLVDDFFRTDDFAEDATFYPVSGSGSGSVIPAIFDDGYQETNIGGTSYQNASPRVTVRTSDVPSISVGSVLVMRSVTYYVMTVDNDGTGVSTVHLSKEVITR